MFYYDSIGEPACRVLFVNSNGGATAPRVGSAAGVRAQAVIEYKLQKLVLINGGASGGIAEFYVSVSLNSSQIKAFRECKG
jgi:hypothetical protein